MLNLINTFPLPAIIANADNVIIHANELGLNHFKTNLDSIQNKSIAFIFSEVSGDKIHQVQHEENGEVYHLYYIQESSNTEAKQLVYSVAHDLQDPLNSISAYSKLLAEEHFSQLDAEGNLYVDFISKSAKRMQNTIQSLLDFTKLNSIADFAATNLNQVIQEVQEDLSLAIKESNAKILFEKLPTVMGSSVHLRLLFQNLIGNALKFSRKEEQPFIFISSDERESDWLFQVKDNGIGIPSENLEAVFSIFIKLHTTSEYEGSGIGLAHCKKIVALHGGTIWAESEIGKGTVIYFTISKI
jgi:light-regulated signal transduction histidine kinase (bacteriophytochrome)